jgi:hypothetical protein
MALKSGRSNVVARTADSSCAELFAATAMYCMGPQETGYLVTAKHAETIGTPVFQGKMLAVLIVVDVPVKALSLFANRNNVAALPFSPIPALPTSGTDA